MVETVYIARHGFRVNWVERNWTTPTGLARDPPLAAYGIKQAGDLANYLASLPEDKRPTLLLSSPYYRCLQTAQPTSELLNLPILVEHGLSEWYSPAEPGTGLYPRPSGPQVLQNFFPSIDVSWQSLYLPDRRGETILGVHTRCDEFLRALVTYPRVKEHKNILLVSHAATVIALVRGLVGNPALDLRVGTCALSVLNKKKEEEFKWEADGVLARGDFLPNGIERDWGFEDVQLDETGTVVNDSGVKGTEKEDPGISGLVWEKPRL